MRRFIRTVAVGACVLFSVAAISAQSKTAAEAKGPTQNPPTSVVAPSGYTVRLVDTLPPAAPQTAGGKWHNVTRWNGRRWVTKLEWFPNRAPRTTGPQPIEIF